MNDTGIEHSDEDNHAELRAAVEEIDFDEFEGVYEDFYKDTANPSTSKCISACVMAVSFHIILAIYISNYKYCCISFIEIVANIIGTCRPICRCFYSNCFCHTNISVFVQ